MPQRFLRPGITTSQRFNNVDWIAQSFYVRLLTLVDDFGRYESGLMLLRSHVFPLGDCFGKDVPLKTIENICLQLSAANLVQFYKADCELLQISRWNEKPRAEKSKYQEFTESCKQMFSNDNKCLLPSSSSSSSSSPSPSPIAGAINAPRGISFPENLLTPKFQETWNQWEQFRRETRHPLTAIGRRTQLNMLSTWGEPRAIAAIENTIFMGWQGLKEPTLNRSPNSTNGFKPQKPVDPAKVDLPDRFKGWAIEHNVNRRDEIATWKTWADVPPGMQKQWWGETKPAFMR